MNYCHNCMSQLEIGSCVCPYCGHDNEMSHNPVDTLRDGTILNGKFLAGHILGRGGFGITYLGYDLTLRVKVAIKEYFPSGVGFRLPNSNQVHPSTTLTTPDDFEKGCNEFQSEAITLASFNSPNIVRVREYFRENGTAYIVMDYIEGNTLTKEIENCGGKIPWQRVLDLFKPLILELDKLHEKHLIHRDIKPDNLKLVKDGKNGGEHLVLLDFGSARSFVSAEITQTHTAMVTPGYAPAEQYSRRSRQGAYTDVYALCATMYALITGSVPPDANDRLLGAAELQPLSSFGLHIPPSIENALVHGLAMRSADRTQSMHELYEELIIGRKVDAREGDYQNAIRLMQEGTEESLQKASELLEKASGWKDADRLTSVCRNRVEDLRQQAIYEKAEQAIRVGTKNSYKEALRLYEEIRGYKDADRKAALCRKELRAGTGIWIVLAVVLFAAACAGYFLLRPKGTEELDASSQTQTALVVMQTEVKGTKEAFSTGQTKTVEAADRQATQEVIALTQTKLAEESKMLQATQTKAIQPTSTPIRKPVSTNTPQMTETSINISEVFTLGHQAFEEKDYAKALPLLRQAAEAGNADAMVDLGRMYARGLGIEENDTQAVSWFRKAAEQNHAGGQYWMGVMYRFGEGVTRDYTQAYEWYLKAADQNYANAQYAIAQFYEYGDYNLPQDYTKAYEWYKKAADNGSDGALVALGQMYEYGRGFEKDEKRALEFYKKAADHGSDFAMIQIGSLYKSQKSFSNAEKWYLKAIEQQGPNSAYAEYNMGNLYSDYYFNENASEAVKEANYEKSRKWYLKAAEDGADYAWEILGNIYLFGFDNAQQSYETALYYYQQGAEAGDANCMMDIAEMYYRGYGVPVSYERTIEYLGAAVEKEHYGACLQLGLLYEYGIGVAKDLTEANRLYRYVVEHGDNYIIDAAQKLLDGNRKNIPSYIDSLYQELLRRISLDSYQLFRKDIGTLSDRYVLMDLDGNSSDELVIGSAHYIESIYKIKNENMEDILKNLEDNNYDFNPKYTLCKNYIIQKKDYLSGHSGISSYTSYYRYTGNGFSFIEAIVESKSYDYYHSTSSEISLSGQKLDFYGRKAIEERYPEMDLNWIMLK